MSYTIVNFIDPNDDQPTVAIFNEDRSRVSVFVNVQIAIKGVRARPRLGCAVAELLAARAAFAEYAAAVDVALKGDGEPFIVA